MSQYPIRHVHIKSQESNLAVDVKSIPNPSNLDITLSTIRDLMLRRLEQIGTRKLVCASKTTSGDTLYSVPSGRYCYLIAVSCYNTGAYYGRAMIYDELGFVIYSVAHEAVAYKTATIVFPIPVRLGENAKITLEFGGGTEWGSMYGYEV